MIQIKEASKNIFETLIKEKYTGWICFTETFALSFDHYGITPSFLNKGDFVFLKEGKLCNNTTPSLISFKKNQVCFYFFENNLLSRKNGPALIIKNHSLQIDNSTLIFKLEGLLKFNLLKDIDDFNEIPIDLLRKHHYLYRGSFLFDEKTPFSFSLKKTELSELIQTCILKKELYNII